MTTRAELSMMAGEQQREMRERARSRGEPEDTIGFFLLSGQSGQSLFSSTC